jgi:enamine deaminase RidA (YjgF/YER057c/UK114 family)
MQRTHVSTDTAYEQRNKYARAVRVGPHVWSAGTMAIDDYGDVPHPDSAYQQTYDAFAKIEAAMRDLGADRSHVVRTRMYITRGTTADEVGKAHADFFGNAFPAATMIEIKGLAHPAALVEVELDAYVPSDG